VVHKPNRVAVWLILKTSYVFVIRLDGAAPRVAHGRVAPNFVEELGEVCAAAGLTRGWVGGVRRGRRVVLAFSRNIPPPVQQRLRNLWALHA